MFAALKDKKLLGRWSRRRTTIADSSSQLPTPTASFANRFVLPENSVHLEAGGRFVFQCTFDSLYVYDLLWSVRRRFELPECRAWSPFFQLVDGNRILLAHQEPHLRWRLFVAECSIDFETEKIKVLRKFAFDVADPAASAFTHVPFGDLIQTVSSTRVGVFGRPSGAGRKVWICEAGNPQSYQPLMIPSDFSFVRFSHLFDRTLVFFGDSLQRVWQFKRIFAINVDTGSIAQWPLSSLLPNEEDIAEVQIADGEWNLQQQFSCTLNVQTADGKRKRLFFLLDLPTRVWRHLPLEEFGRPDLLDVKHRVDATDGSLVLLVNRTDKTANHSAVYRRFVRQPPKLSDLAFGVVLRSHPQVRRLDGRQLRRLGLSAASNPIFRPEKKIQSFRPLLFYFTAAFSVLALGYYLLQVLLLTGLSFKRDLDPRGIWALCPE